MHSIIVDLGFGDSGKGAIADRLAAQDPDNTVVIRYTGGSQAGHNVVIGDKSHVHSSFAAGALGGIRSHISAFCPINPHNLIREARELITKTNNHPRAYASVDPLCPLITGPDRAWNRLKAIQNGRKNTVGLGVGAAMYRHESSPHRIFAADLLYRDLYLKKLKNIVDYYRSTFGFTYESTSDDFEFPEIQEFVKIIPTAQVVNEREHIVFEGAQGVMLDRDHGFFPDVTYGHTTMRNALELLPKGGVAIIHYVTRSYCTRHGDGPMGQGAQLDLIDPTNHDGGFQGKFRTAELDFELLNYAFKANEAYADDRIEDRVLHITCCDRHQLENTKPLRAITNCDATHLWYGADRSAYVERFITP